MIDQRQVSCLVGRHAERQAEWQVERQTGSHLPCCLPTWLVTCLSVLSPASLPAYLLFHLPAASLSSSAPSALTSDRRSSRLKCSWHQGSLPVCQSAPGLLPPAPPIDPAAPTPPRPWRHRPTRPWPARFVASTLPPIGLLPLPPAYVPPPPLCEDRFSAPSFSAPALTSGATPLPCGGVPPAPKPP